MPTSDANARGNEPCPQGRTDYDECFAPFRYCPVKGCGRAEGDVQLPTDATQEAPSRDDLIRNLLDMAQKRVEAAQAGPEERVLHPETWTIPHTHYNDVRTNDCGHDLHVGWLEIAQEVENVQQLMDHLGIPDGLPQGMGDADWRVAEAVLRLTDAQERLFRIAQNHSRETGPAGTVGDFCVECNWRWPCPSYRFANGDGEVLDPWRDDE